VPNLVLLDRLPEVSSHFFAYTIQHQILRHTDCTDHGVQGFSSLGLLPHGVEQVKTGAIGEDLGALVPRNDLHIVSM
jgi:hypothetical protein